MRSRLIVVLGLGAIALAGPAVAADTPPDPFGTPVPAEMLRSLRGGSDTTVNNSAIQSNTTNQDQSNSGDISLSGQFVTKYSGTISAAQVTGNSGITTVLQNTGDMVNLSNATNVNVYIH